MGRNRILDDLRGTLMTLGGPCGRMVVTIQTNRPWTSHQLMTPFARHQTLDKYGGTEYIRPHVIPDLAASYARICCVCTRWGGVLQATCICTGRVSVGR